MCNRRSGLGESGFGSGREASDESRPPQPRMSAHTEARLRRFARVEARKEERRRAYYRVKDAKEREEERREKESRRRSLEMAVHFESPLADLSWLLSDSDSDSE